jgi:hypothetical protein
MNTTNGGGSPTDSMHSVTWACDDDSPSGTAHNQARSGGYCKHGQRTGLKVDSGSKQIYTANLVTFAVYKNPIQESSYLRRSDSDVQCELYYDDRAHRIVCISLAYRFQVIPAT